MSSANVFDLNSYGYDLPEELIAQYPSTERDKARLMVINRKDGTISHDVFANIAKHLPSKSTIVINNSRVIPARLLGRRASGGEVEIFLLKALSDGYSFEALIRPLKKIKEGESIEFAPGVVATLVDKEQRIVAFNKKDILRHLENVGHIPLPPYIKRGDEPSDREEYQTVYAKSLGSVASPTAGLHFTKTLMGDIESLGHTFKELTLHINYGTFKPVECDDIREHPMHTEGYALSSTVYQDILKAKTQGRSVVAVGTTSSRVLESVGLTGKLEGQTDMFIYPGYQFNTVDVLITNFHLPYSTLLMLVSAFGGYELIKRAYAEAINEKYRFYSYGDAMIIL